MVAAVRVHDWLKHIASFTHINVACALYNSIYTVFLVIKAPEINKLKSYNVRIVNEIIRTLNKL